MKRKIALFLFAFGVSTSAMSGMWNCENMCFYEYNQCVAAGEPWYQCEDFKWSCLGSCGIQQP
ncbi:hypothetical protein V8J88_10590 [Massilia sp. W12]|uniref:hypothetical protein n=1 Tax=Massilia sp. W12 TaxID=3126507 RepID=UPI0030CBB66F